jgi:uncharacterized membrane protein YhaH (DUF805 family)
MNISRINILKLNFGRKIGRTEYWLRLALSIVFKFTGVGFFYWWFWQVVTKDHGEAMSEWYQNPISLVGALIILYSFVYLWNNILGRLRDAERSRYGRLISLIIVGAIVPFSSLIFLVVIGCFKTPNAKV